MSKWWTVVVLASFAGACTFADSSEDIESIEEAGPQAIIGGEPATDYPSAALINMTKPGENHVCSGSLIAPRVVLTAGHCVAGYSTWEVILPFAGDQASSGEGVVYDYTENPDNQVNLDQRDVGLVILDEALSIETYPTLAGSQVEDGSEIINIGRIQDGTQSHSALFKGPAVPIRSAAEYGYELYYVGDVIIQPGDSGGPAMRVGTREIVAVNSGSTDTLQVLARVDVLRDWVQQHIDDNEIEEQPEPPKPEQPGTECSLDGASCAGTVMTWCAEGDLIEVDCRDFGMTCKDLGGGALTCTF